jgi:hypothetical protein
VDLLAYRDLDGRSGLKLALQEVDGHFFRYVAGFWHSGWSILEVTDAEHPELLRFLDGPPNTMTVQVLLRRLPFVHARSGPEVALSRLFRGRAAAARSRSPVLISACECIYIRVRPTDRSGRLMCT